MPINRNDSVYSKLTKKDREILGIRSPAARSPEEILERQTGEITKGKREVAEKLKRPAVGEWE